MNVRVSIHDIATGPTADVLRRMRGIGLTRAIGRAVQLECREHLRGLAQTRHATARRLGGTPSNILAQAAEQVALENNLTAERDQATIDVTSPALVRAFRDVLILPSEGRKYLTFPVVGAAYNKRATTFSSLRLAFRRIGGQVKCIGLEMPVRYITRRARKGLGAERAPKSMGVLFYVFRRQALQKQDPTLLPSEPQMQAAAALGAADYMTELQSAKLATA